MSYTRNNRYSRNRWTYLSFFPKQSEVPDTSLFRYSSITLWESSYGIRLQVYIIIYVFKFFNSPMKNIS